MRARLAGAPAWARRCWTARRPRIALRVAGALLCAAGVIAAGTALGHRLDPTFPARRAALKRAPPFPVPSFWLPDQDGRLIGRDQLLGRIWVASFLSSGCGETSTVVGRRMAALAEATSGLGAPAAEVRFISFSASSDDSPEALSRYCRGFGCDRRWRLLANGGRGFSSLAIGMGLVADETELPAALAAQSRFLFLVDGSAIVRGVYDALIDREFRRLRDDLLRATPLSRGGSPRAAAARASPAGATSSHPLFRSDLPILGEVTPFDYRDQDGARLGSVNLRGHTFIADLIFTSCRGACPVLSARMVALQRAIPDDGVRFISFSVDPETDTPAVLADYARRWHGDQRRWRLLATDRPTLTATVNGLQLTSQQTSEAPDSIIHSDRFVLVDRGGKVRQLYDSNDPLAMRRLADDAHQLEAAGVTPPATVALGQAAPDGRALFTALGCQGCHGQPQIAGPLEGLAGRSVRLEGGVTVVADPRYLRESILDPLAKLVEGYPPIMPSYAGLIDERELSALVSYLAASAQPATPDATAARQR